MIIRPRMPRMLNRRSRTGILGLRSLQRSVVHVRRMVISRLPERAPEDIQSAIEQPLIWAGQQPLLSAPTEPITLDAGQHHTTPFHQPNRRGQRTQPVQRQTDVTSAETMPRDLQAIFNLHRDKGNINPQNSFMDEIRADLTTQGKTPPPPSRPLNKPSVPPPPAPTPIQRQPDNDDFPVVVEPPPPRRVRSKVEYVRPSETASASVQKQSEPEGASDDDPSLLLNESVQRAPDDQAAETIYDFGDDLPDATPDSYEMDHVQQAIHRAEAPTASPSPQLSLRRDEVSVDPAYVDESTHIDQSIERSTPTAETAPADDVQQAIRRAEAPTASPPPQLSLSRAEALSTSTLTEGTAPSEDAQQAIRRIDAESYFATVVDAPIEQSIQRAIADAERFTDESTQSAPSSIGQRPRKLTVSNSTPPMQVQAWRFKTPNESEEESALDNPSLAEDSNVADGDNDNATTEMPRQEEEPATGTVQMRRDDTPGYGFAEPDLLPEQAVDLGTALFGGSPATPQPIRRRTQADSLPTVMPPIGRAQHQSPPQLFMRRATDSAPDVESYIQRAEAHDLDEDDYREPTEDESGLLSLLDIPQDTPIQKSKASVPNIQASRDDIDFIQREVEIGEMSTSLSETSETSEAGGASSEPNPEDVKKMANQVYSIIKRRLKVEQERLRGRK